MAFVGSAFKTFWHTMTSYDRHSDGNSPYRTGQHVPLPQSRHAPLTSVATSASESRQDINSPYFEEQASLNGGAAQYPNSPFPSSPGPHSPYSPGMRSSSALRRSNTNDNFENAGQGEIQMQSFQEGLPPAPPVSHSWKRIDRWAEENYEELFDQLCEGCTNNDLNELEHQLDCSLPLEVRESLQFHDGQERGGLPTGIIFGCMLLDCEEIVQEWENWKKVNSEYLSPDPINFKPTTPLKTHNGMGASSASASSSKQPGSASSQNPMWRQDLLAKQDSVPPNAIQKVYAHAGWIPLVRDWGGNNLAIDLAPGPAGRWGQIILFGRDYDRKYVIARSWSAFIATVADDLSSGKWFVDEDSGELKLREFKSSKVEPGYFDILRWRMDEKWKRMSNGGGAGNRRSMPNGMGSPVGSPYASPTTEVGGEPRGRSMQRFSGASPVQSPNRTSYSGAGGAANSAKSPLARVTEEGGNTKTAAKPLGLGIETRNASIAGKLVELETPRTSESVDDKPTTKGNMDSMMKEVSLQDGDDNKENQSRAGGISEDKEIKTRRESLLNGDGNVVRKKGEGVDGSGGDGSGEEMKTIDI